MTLNHADKQKELAKYRALILSTLDYYIEYKIIDIVAGDFDSNKYFFEMKSKCEEDFKKGRLTWLKQVFRDLTEMQIENKDFRFSKYLQEKSGYEVNIFQAFFQRIDKIIKQGKITTNNQYYEISNLVNQMISDKLISENEIKNLNKLMIDYEKRKPIK